jgi:hypothetical protein
VKRDNVAFRLITLLTRKHSIILEIIMKKSMIKTIAVIAVLGLAGNAQANTQTSNHQDPQDPSSVTIGDVTSNEDSNNTKTDTNTFTKTDTKTVGDITKADDSYNTKTDTNTFTNTDTKTDTNTFTNTDTKTVGDITKTDDSYNTKTEDSNNTKTVTKTEDSNNSKIEDSYNTRTTTVDVTKTTTVDVTKNIAKAEDASVATAAGRDATVTANITSLNVKDGLGAIIGGNVNVAAMEGNMHVDSVNMGGVGVEAANGAQGKGCDNNPCRNSDEQAAVGSGSAYAMSNIMTGNVADGIGINSGNLYQLTSAPSATAVNGNYNISSTRGNN